MPSDASTSIDRINIISSSNEDVLRVAQNKLCLMADSAGESVITLQSKNVTKTYTLKVNYKEATGIKFSSDFKETITSNETMNFKVERDKNNKTKEILKEVYDALQEKGYNPVNQIVGYILSGDPTYITSHKNARNIIRTLERDELLEKMVKSYIEVDE